MNKVLIRLIVHLSFTGKMGVRQNEMVGGGGHKARKGKGCVAEKFKVRKKKKMKRKVHRVWEREVCMKLKKWMKLVVVG